MKRVIVVILLIPNGAKDGQHAQDSLQEVLPDVVPPPDLVVDHARQGEEEDGQEHDGASPKGPKRLTGSEVQRGKVQQDYIRHSLEQADGGPDVRGEVHHAEQVRGQRDQQRSPAHVAPSSSCVSLAVRSK